MQGGTDTDEGRKRKLEEPGLEESRTPRGGAGIGRLQSGGGNAMREKVHKLLTDALSSGEDSNRQRIRSIADEVEASLYDSCKGVNEQYKKKAQTLKFNISTNEELREQVVERSIRPSNLVNMSTADLARKDLKKRRVTAAEESLKEVVNNEEVQKLKQAAAGLTMRKTDQGLVALQEKEKEEEARRKDEEEKERARKKQEEEDQRRKEKEKETLVTAGLDMGQDDEKSYLSTFAWKPSEGDEADGDGAGSMEEDDSMVMSSPTLDDNQDAGGHMYDPQITLPTLEDPEALDEPRAGGGEGGGHLVWHGTLCPTSGRKDAFDLDASLVDGQGVHDLMPTDLSVKGTLALHAVKDYLESKMRDKSKERSVYKLTPHHEQQHDSKAHELYRQFTESLRRHQKAGVLIDSKQMLLYAVPPGNQLAASLVSDDDAGSSLIAVALTSRRKAAQRSVADITADVSADFRTALGAEEKMVKLMASVFGKVRTADCNLRASLVAGPNRLEVVPRELGVRGRAGLDQVIEYLLQQQVMVIEFEPEGEEDSATYLQISDLLQERRRAAVVLDTASALMYLIPPVDEAGKLLDPPADSCSNMLGVLLINQQGDAGTKDRADQQHASETPQEPAGVARQKRGGTPPTPPDGVLPARQPADSGPAEVAIIPAPNGAAKVAAAVPTVGAASQPVGHSNPAAAVRENRPSPVVVPQGARATGVLSPEVDPSPRPYYTPTAAAADTWKQSQPQQPFPPQPHHPVAPPAPQHWTPPAPAAPFPPQAPVHPHRPEAPPPHPYHPGPVDSGERYPQPFNPSRPAPPHHAPPPNHMAMNHPPLQYPMDAQRPPPPPHLAHGPPGGGMPGNAYPVPGGGMGVHGPGMHGMQGPPNNMYNMAGRGQMPNGNPYPRGPPQGYHRNF